MTEPSGQQQRVYTQAKLCADFVCEGKGQERHGHGHDVMEQPWVFIEEFIPGFCEGQAVKKIVESQSLDGERRVRELRGAVGYLLLALIAEEKKS